MPKMKKLGAYTALLRDLSNNDIVKILIDQLDDDDDRSANNATSALHYTHKVSIYGSQMTINKRL